MNGGMEHLSPSDGHDGANGTFGDTILMMSTGTGKPDDLSELTKLGGESGRREGGAIVRLILLWENTVVTAHLLVVVFGFQGFMGV
jgi:hypothetical protein